jgi:hypothetical protein
VSGTVDPGADPRLRFDEPMRCICGGTGTVTDASDAGAGWWLVTWYTEHAAGCGGLAAPERAYLVDAEAFAAGDVALPGLEAEHVRHLRLRRRQEPLSPYDVAQLARRRVNGRTGCRECQPDPDHPATWVLCGEHRCQAVAAVWGQRCRNPAGPGGLCHVHRRRP